MISEKGRKDKVCSVRAQCHEVPTLRRQVGEEQIGNTQLRRKKKKSQRSKDRK